MRFTKMHGIGNDYVYVNTFLEKLPAEPAVISQAVSHRNFGIGSDGLILIGPSEVADARMRMFNADGSEAEMCGNGLRCVAKYVHDHNIAKKPTLTIETGRGVLSVDLDVVNGMAQKVRVNMGEPILEAAKIPTTLPGDPPVDAVLCVGGREFQATCVSMGNPHATAYVGDEFFATTGPDLVAQFGPLIENAPAFPRPGERPLREGAVADRSDDANLGTRQRHHPRLWHRGVRRLRGRRADGPDRAETARPPAGRRPGTGVVGGRQQRVHDRPRARKCSAASGRPKDFGFFGSSRRL